MKSSGSLVSISFSNSNASSKVSGIGTSLSSRVVFPCGAFPKLKPDRLRAARPPLPYPGRRTALTFQFPTGVKYRGRAPLRPGAPWPLCVGKSRSWSRLIDFGKAAAPWPPPTTKNGSARQSRWSDRSAARSPQSIPAAPPAGFGSRSSPPSPRQFAARRKRSGANKPRPQSRAMLLRARFRARRRPRMDRFPTNDLSGSPKPAGAVYLPAWRGPICWPPADRSPPIARQCRRLRSFVLPGWTNARAISPRRAGSDSAITAITPGKTESRMLHLNFRPRRARPADRSGSIGGRHFPAALACHQPRSIAGQN